MLTRHFLLLALSIAVALFVMMSLLLPIYRTEAVFVITPQNNTAALLTDHVVHTVYHLAKRENHHNDVSFKQLSGASAIAVYAMGPDPVTAQKTLRDGLSTLRTITTTYYHVEKDISVRITDQMTRRVPFFLSLERIFWSLFGGMISAIVIFVVYLMTRQQQPVQRTLKTPQWSRVHTMSHDMEEQNEKQEAPLVHEEDLDKNEEVVQDTADSVGQKEISQEPQHERPAKKKKKKKKAKNTTEQDVFEKYTPQESVEELPSEEPASVEESISESVQNQDVTESKPAPTPEKKGGAPGNLPIASVVPSAPEIDDTTSSTPQTAEPTNEELKERLNKLLRGEV